MEDKIISMFKDQFNPNMVNMITEEERLTITDTITGCGMRIDKDHVIESDDRIYIPIHYSLPVEVVDNAGDKYYIGNYHPRSRGWKPSMKVVSLHINKSYWRPSGNDPWQDHVSMDFNIVGEEFRYGRKQIVYGPNGIQLMVNQYGDVHSLVPILRQNITTLKRLIDSGKSLPVPTKYRTKTS